MCTLDEQQFCEGSDISVFDVSVRCAWIACDGASIPRATLGPLTCDTLCRLIDSRDGKDCAYWSDTQACEHQGLDANAGEFLEGDAAHPDGHPWGETALPASCSGHSSA
eukprot:3185873-Amphidinium_carterae.2